MSRISEAIKALSGPPVYESGPATNYLVGRIKDLEAQVELAQKQGEVSTEAARASGYQQGVRKGMGITQSTHSHDTGPVMTEDEFKSLHPAVVYNAYCVAGWKCRCPQECPHDPYSMRKGDKPLTPHDKRVSNPGKHELYVYGQSSADGWGCIGCSYMNSNGKIPLSQATVEHDAFIGRAHNCNNWVSCPHKTEK